MIIVAFQPPSSGPIPVLEFDDADSERVVMRFIGREEHYTIHQDGSGLVTTHYYPHENLTPTEQLKVKIAESLGIPPARALRHGQYAQNRPAIKIGEQSGFYVGGRLINLDLLNPRPSYTNRIQQIIQVENPKFMLTTYFCTPDNNNPNFVNRIQTTLGEFCLEISDPIDPRQNPV